MTIKKVDIGCYGTDRNFLCVYNTTPDELRSLLKRFYLSVRGYPFISSKKEPEDPLVALTVQTKNFLKGPNRYRFKMGSNGGAPEFDAFGGIRLRAPDRDIPDVQVTLKGVALLPVDGNQVVKAHDGSLHVVAEAIDNNPAVQRPMTWLAEVYLNRSADTEQRRTVMRFANTNAQRQFLQRYTKRFQLEHLLKDDTQWNEFLKEYMSEPEQAKEATPETDAPTYGVL